MGSKLLRIHPVESRCPAVRFDSLERLHQVLATENLFQQVARYFPGLITGLCRRRARLSLGPLRLHRYFPKGGLIPAWLPSSLASRTHQDETSLLRSALPRRSATASTMASADFCRFSRPLRDGLPGLPQHTLQTSPDKSCNFPPMYPPHLPLCPLVT